MRLQRIPKQTVYLPSEIEGGYRRFFINSHWRLWLATNDFVHGTYLALFDDGHCERVTVRAGEGDDIMLIKPSDDHAEVAE